MIRPQSLFVGTLMLGVLSFPPYTFASTECIDDAESGIAIGSVHSHLPERSGPRVQTSGGVPHVQIGVNSSADIYDALLRIAFGLPGLEERPTVVSLPGAKGMWLADDVPIKQPESIVSGREFAHIHPDGSLHAPLPLKRAIEVEKKGWGERHPWANRFDGWEGLVMLYSATNEDELETLVQLVYESYIFVTGQSARVIGC